ncbi:hypothetical protein IWW50_000314 [Coemansia erecta]|nr:hypothetical protein IWW50_000314 [Coemansia erecta]
MDIDLLGDSDDQQNCSLGPAIEPQPKSTHKVTEQLAQLDISSPNSPEALNSDINDSDDSDEFGDFLQSETVDSTWGVPQDPVGSVAEQVLEWISGTHISTAPNSGNASAQLLASIDEAWESAVGLMGGHDMKPHIGEIAARLCAVLPTAQNQTIDLQPPPAVAMPSIDSAIELAGMARVASTEDIGQKVCDLVWPLYSRSKDLVEAEDTTSDERTNLVNAYLRLAERTNESPKQPN